jgi:outer membrane protein insertion porin family
MIGLVFLLITASEFKVAKIEINGNEHFTDKVIEGIMLTRTPALFRKGIFNHDIFLGDITAIKNMYRYSGFIDASVAHGLMYDSVSNKVEIELTVEEGEQTLVRGITFSGNTIFKDDYLRNRIASSPADPFDIRKMDLDAYMITTAYDDSGYADVQVTSDHRIEGDSAYIEYLIAENKRQYVGGIEFSGLNHTRRDILEREMILKSGDVFRYELVLKSQRNLYNLGIFKSLRTDIRDSETDNQKIIQFILSEKDAVNIFFRLGYGTRDYLRLGAGIQHINMFGRAWQGKIEGKWSFVEYNINTQLAFPRLLSLPIKYSVGAFYQYKKEIGFTTRGIGGYTAGHTDLFGGIFSTKYELESIRTHFTDTDSIQNDWLQGLTFNWLKDQRNDPLYPSKGSYVNIILETNGILFPSDADYIKATFNRNVFNPVMVFVGAFSFRTGIVYEVSPADEVPVYKRFYCGGTSSVRGYSEWAIGPIDENDNPAGGNILAEISGEVRFPIYRILGGVVFIDGGNVWKTFGDMGSGLRWGTGAGVRLKTPLGSIRLDYGFKIHRQEDESAGALHFAVGEAF